MLIFGTDMHTVSTPLLHAYVWLRRFRHRRGYGVHSPWAFSFIRSVINERGHYYAYDVLAVQALWPRSRRSAPLKVDKLLLRLSNYVQPACVVGVGEALGQSLDYLQAGCRRAKVWQQSASAPPPARVDLLYVPAGEDFAAVFARYAPQAAQGALFVLGGIHANRAALSCWRAIVAGRTAGTTFDLYDVGLVFFDSRRPKQHYVVNF